MKSLIVRLNFNQNYMYFYGHGLIESKIKWSCFGSAAETWPFLVTLLIQCTSLEISSSKRRLPKLIYAKTLRIVVQRAEDAKFSGSY